MKNTQFHFSSNTEHARNWNQLNFRIFNPGSVFLNGCCSGADDVKAIAQIMKDQGVRDVTLLGRNYDGNFAGTPSPESTNAAWNGVDTRYSLPNGKPLALYCYNLSPDGSINEGKLMHPASQFILSDQPVGAKYRPTNTQDYINYTREANAGGNNPVPEYMELIRQLFNKVNNIDNKGAN